MDDRMENGMKRYLHDLEKKVYDWGADIFGVADLSLLEGLTTYPADLLSEFSRGISIGVVLSRNAIETITDGPTPLYAFQYKAANALLDIIALRVAKYIEKLGFPALPIPASHRLWNENGYVGSISHKAVARAAGLGWIGKSALLVTPKYGPRIRLSTVLTDMPLPPGTPMACRCGTCSKCIEACLVGAIQGGEFEDYPLKREDIFIAQRCSEKLDEFARNPDIGVTVCGICIKACPYG
jgi:epoxyqueuosine reductase QueG